MHKLKKYTLIRTTAMLVMMAYVFIMVAYLFFTPVFQNNGPSGNAGLTVNTQLIYNLIRTNRCMMNDNKPAKSQVKLYAAHFISQKSITGKTPLLLAGNTSALYFLIDHHFAYLSNRVLRI